MHQYGEKILQMEAACLQEREARDALQARVDVLLKRLGTTRNE